jgi:hypothetical protein
MAVGVVCMIFYILAALNGASAAAMRVGRWMFYVGIVAIIVGFVVRLSRQIPRP